MQPGSLAQGDDGVDGGEADAGHVALDVVEANNKNMQKMAAAAAAADAVPASATKKAHATNANNNNNRMSELADMMHPHNPHCNGGGGGGGACNERGQEAVGPQQIPDEIQGYDLSDKLLLGRGAFSLVYRGVQKHTGDRAAIKAVTLAPENPDGFHAELKANHVVRGHPNIVTLLDSVAPQPSTGYLLFELCERGEVFDQIVPNVGLMPRELIGSHFAQLVEAVAHLHSKGVCHLDVKPENLFVDAAGRVKLGDFGLSTFAEDGPVFGCRGSFAYAAPENVKSVRKAPDAYGCRSLGQGYDGQKADMWSVGVVLFVLLYGLTPWDVAKDTSYEYRMYKVRAALRPARCPRAPARVGSSGPRRR